jgi:uncharacterized OB-fold protein
MWKFIAVFVVVFFAGLAIREITKKKTAPPPDRTVIYDIPARGPACPDCGAVSNTGDKFCRSCGRKLT